MLLRGEDAQRILLAGAALRVYNVRALVHVDRPLREGCGLQDKQETLIIPQKLCVKEEKKPH